MVSSVRGVPAFPRLDHTVTQQDDKSKITITESCQSRIIKGRRKHFNITSNFSLFPLIFMRELRHSPTTMPICLMRTTLLSRWLCMPPSMHCSNSRKRGPQPSKERFLSANTSLLLLLLLFFLYLTAAAVAQSRPADSHSAAALCWHTAAAPEECASLHWG